MNPDQHRGSRRCESFSPEDKILEGEFLKLNLPLLFVNTVLKQH